MRKEKKKNYYVLIIFLLVFIAIVSLVYFNSGARYTSTSTDNQTKVEVGKWSVLVNTVDITTAANLDGEITLTPIASADVAPTKIVPGGVAFADIEIDMSAADVSGSYAITFDATALAAVGLEGFEVLGYEKNPTTTPPTNVAASLASTATGTIQYSATKANMKETVRVFITWEHDDSYNASQTTAGKAAATKIIPVTVKVDQVLPTY